jgi:hypothetical protein
MPAPRSKFFLLLSVSFVVIAIVGFSTTFFIPIARGAFRAPAVVHIHGMLLFGWLALLVAQSSLIVRRRFFTHRRLGFIGGALAISIVISGVLVGLYATRRDLSSETDPFVLGQFVNIVIEMILFGAFVAAAVAVRRDGESHKRFMILATISALGPAWLRFRHLFPEVPHPFIVFSVLADSMLLLVIARDWIAIRRVHPVYVYAGGAMVTVHTIELLAITSQPWIRLSRWLIGEPGA